MPEPIAHFEHALAAVLAPDLRVRVQVRHVRDLGTQAQLGVFSGGMDGGFQWTEIAREIEVLIGRQTLIGKDQDGIEIEGRFDFGAACARQGSGEVDIADLGGEVLVNRANNHRVLRFSWPRRKTYICAVCIVNRRRCNSSRRRPSGGSLPSGPGLRSPTPPRAGSSSSSGIPELALVTNAQKTDYVTLRQEPVEREKSGLASRDDQLPQPMLGRAADQRMIGQDHHCASNGCDLGNGKPRVVFGIKVEYAREVFQRALGERYFRQDLALGRRARLPSARAVM